MGDIVIYDTETSDADVRHGQIFQYGGIRANEDLNVMEDVNLRIRRASWVVPSPDAMRVTGIKPVDLDTGVSEYEASKSIESFMVPGYGQHRIFITFNGINFDDEIIRTTQFRNLRNPWITSGKQSTKVDLLPIVQLVAAADPGVIKIPLKEDGGKSFRLEHLCPANGIEIDAHDALGDTYSTLGLAKLIKEKAPWAWDTALRCGLAQRNETLLSDACRAGKPLLLFRHFGEPEVIPCAILGTDNKKKWVLLDLRSEKYPESADDIRDQMFKKGTPFPVIRSNASPIFLDAHTARALNANLDYKHLIQKALGIKRSSLGASAKEALLANEYTRPEAPTSEDLIYGSFVSDREKPKMTAFHRAETWEKRLEISFEDERLADFASRIMLEAYIRGEANFDAEVVTRLKDTCSKVLHRPYAGPDARWMTIDKALQTADEEWLNWYRSEFEIGGATSEFLDQSEEVESGIQYEMRF